VGTAFSRQRCVFKNLEHRAKKWAPLFRVNDAFSKT
jgi:hypothetical protein